MFAGLGGKGINYSNNYGQSWGGTNITGGVATDSMVDPSLSNYYNFVSMSGGGGVKASTNRTSWVNKNNGLNTDVYALERIGNGIYLAGTVNGVYKTTNAGDSWERKTGLDNIKVTDLLLDPTNSSIIWATTYEGLYQSTDAGDTWSPYPIADLLNKKLITIVAIPGVHEFYLGADGGDIYHFAP